MIFDMALKIGLAKDSDIDELAVLEKKIINIMNTLTERECEVLELRFGLKDGNLRTLEEVSRQLDMTTERIRQIEAKALRKARHPSRLQKLEGSTETGSGAPGPDKASGAGVVNLADLIKQQLEDKDRETDQ